ncbi:MAG TPA: DUF779 domain-containing protein [Solirubrobacterales bacterium]|jgi:uncharacterized protein (DUF779 family)
MSAPSPIRSGKAGPACDQRVWTTPQAIDVIAHMRAEMGHLVLRHTGGRQGTAEARLVTMPTQAARADFCVGVAGGVPFYVDCDEDAALGYPDFFVDVVTAPGRGEAGSREGCQQLVSRAVAPEQCGR